MRTYFFRARWLFSLLLLTAQHTISKADSPTAEYRGFTIDRSQVQTVPDLGEIEKTLNRQIDVIYAVGLPPEIITFFQSVPLVVIPADSIPRSSPGLYGRKERSVKMTTRITSIGTRPVLLHELLHAYHHQKLPDGFQNTLVIGFFNAAHSEKLYRAKSHMMQNPSEFFACAATTYLHGTTAQEPETRGALKEKQPELFSFLNQLFGKSAGLYEEAIASNQER